MREPTPSPGHFQNRGFAIARRSPVDLGRVVFAVLRNAATNARSTPQQCEQYDVCMCVVVYDGVTMRGAFGTAFVKRCIMSTH